MTKSRVGDLLKLVVAIGLLVWLVLRLPDPAALWWQIVHAHKLLLVLGAACYTLAVAVSALKWRVLLHAAGIVLPPGRLLSFQWMAEFFNNFLPAQVGGDVMRGYAVAADTKRTADAAASVIIDRFIGLMVFMPLYLLKGMAAGDVKLMGVIGLYSGAALTLDIALLTALIGGLWVITLFQWQMHGDPKRIRQFGICLRHRSVRPTTNAKASAQNKSLLIPYGAVIATGTVLALLIASH